MSAMDEAEALKHKHTKIHTLIEEINYINLEASTAPNIKGEKTKE